MTRRKVVCLSVVFVLGALTAMCLFFKRQTGSWHNIPGGPYMRHETTYTRLWGTPTWQRVEILNPAEPQCTSVAEGPLDAHGKRHGTWTLTDRDPLECQVETQTYDHGARIVVTDGRSPQRDP